MKRAKKTSLGIVLTDRYIEAVCLEMLPSHEMRVRGGRIDLPNGIIHEGNVISPTKAGGLIQKLLRREGILFRRATVVLPDSQILAQILELPGELPANIHKFIHTEIRYSPILTRRTPCSDYRTLGADEEGKEKILIGVTTQQCIENLVQTFSLAGVEVLSLEMDFCSLYRLFYSRLFSMQKPENLVLAGVTGKTLTICVFLQNRLDFVQRFPISIEPDAFRASMLKQLQTVKQFYEIEHGYSFHQGWKTVTVLDTVPQDGPEWVSELHALFGESADFFTPANLQAITQQECKAEVAYAGYGAALKTIEPVSGLQVPELLPRLYKEQYAWKRAARMTAVLTAGLLLVLYTGTWLFQSLYTAQGAPIGPGAGRMAALANEQRQYLQEIEALRKQRRIAEDLAGQKGGISCYGILQEIRERIPKGLQITSLEITKSGILSLRGQALGFQTIHQFASALEQSEQIETAEVAESRISSVSSRIYDYQILCQLTRSDPGKDPDVSVKSR